jgi:hypothetical protein
MGWIAVFWLLAALIYFEATGRAPAQNADPQKVITVLQKQRNDAQDHAAAAEAAALQLQEEIIKLREDLKNEKAKTAPAPTPGAPPQ